MVNQALQPYLNTRADEPFRFLGLPTVIRSTSETTNGAFGLTESWSMPVGFASPYHTHHLEDEAFYVIEGQLAVVVDGKWLLAGPGTYVFGPREIAHGFQVVGTLPVRMLLLCAPGGFERFVLDQATPIDSPAGPPDMAKMMELAARHKIDIHGPLPELPPDLARQEDAAVDLKALNHRWIQAFNERDWATEAAVRSPDFRAYLSGGSEPLDFEQWSGFMNAFTTGFPDARISIQGCISEGDNVATQWTLSGTHHGSFQGIPATGRSVKFSGVEYNRAAGGKFTEHHSQFDLVSLLRQIGATPA